jgi:hypothetical protein
MRKTPWVTFTGAVFAGVLLGIFFLTGISLAPDDIIQNVGETVINQTGDQMLLSAWHQYSFYFLLAGTLAGILEIYMIYRGGKVFIISGLSGFLAGIMLILSPVTGVFILIGGAVFSWLFTRFWWRRKSSKPKK